jgi:hypothetical protein
MKNPLEAKWYRNGRIPLAFGDVKIAIRRTTVKKSEEPRLTRQAGFCVCFEA